MKLPTIKWIDQREEAVIVLPYSLVKDLSDEEIYKEVKLLVDDFITDRRE